MEVPTRESSRESVREAVVALLRQQWLPAAAFTVAWLLILGSPRVFPLLQDPAEAP